jgi:G protein-coupled receptor Mth (Methuselah protein)
VALVCFENDLEYSSGAVHILYGICLFISCIFLVATLMVYVLLPELRDIQGLCLMANIFSLILGYFALAFIQIAGHSVGEEGCIFSGS